MNRQVLFPYFRVKKPITYVDDDNVSLELKSEAYDESNIFSYELMIGTLSSDKF